MLQSPPKLSVIHACSAGSGEATTGRGEEGSWGRAKEKKKRQAAAKALAEKAQKKAEAAERHAEAVRAAAVRCPECNTGLPGKMTDYFEMCGIYYCSTACVKAARLANV